MNRWFTLAWAACFALVPFFNSQPARATVPPLNFRLTVSGGAAGCMPNAQGLGTLSTIGPNQKLHINVAHLKANTVFTVFLIQSPTAPFGSAWYQGDIVTNAVGAGEADFIGIFGQETFIVGAGSAPSPIVFNGPFPDASTNPPFNPVHQYHVGMWFDSPTDATAIGCPPNVTPFNGAHNAGIQVLNTATFGQLNGPLRIFRP